MNIICDAAIDFCIFWCSDRSNNYIQLEVNFILKLTILFNLYNSRCLNLNIMLFYETLKIIKEIEVFPQVYLI